MPGQRARGDAHGASHSNSERLGFDAGPLGGALISVGLLTPANEGRYLEVSNLELPVANLKALAQPTASGNGALSIQRQGDTCFGEFPNFSQHHRLAKLELDFDLLKITTASLPNATVNFGYSATLVPGGGKAPLTWAATWLPAALTLDAATGALSGAAGAAGTFALDVSVMDADGKSARRSLSLTVATPANLVYVGNVTTHVEKTSTSPTDGSVSNDSNIIKFSNLRLELRPDGTFSGTGTADFFSANKVTALVGCVTERQLIGIVPVTVTAGTLAKPSSLGLRGNAMGSEIGIQTGCSTPDFKVTSLSVVGAALIASPLMTPAYLNGKLVALIWAGSFSDSTGAMNSRKGLCPWFRE